MNDIHHTLDDGSDPSGGPARREVSPDGVEPLRSTRERLEQWRWSDGR